MTKVDPIKHRTASRNNNDDATDDNEDTQLSNDDAAAVSLTITHYAPQPPSCLPHWLKETDQAVDMTITERQDGHCCRATKIVNHFTYIY